MSNFKSLSLLFVFLGLGIAAGGCAAPTAEEAAAGGESEEALKSSKLKLPKGDECRDVLAPLALGLADGGVGLDFARSVTVSLTSETDTRLYTVSITQDGAPLAYEVELDNDSASTCLLLNVKSANDAKLAHDSRSSATAKETHASVPVTVSPANDDCASTVKLLAQAAAVSAVGASNVVGVRVELVGETEDRDYVVHVDGKSFVANGETFPNDWDFDLNVSNDSAFKCFVQEFHGR